MQFVVRLPDFSNPLHVTIAYLIASYVMTFLFVKFVVRPKKADDIIACCFCCLLAPIMFPIGLICLTILLFIEIIAFLLTGKFVK